MTTEVKPAEENPFYSSYDAMEEKEELEDPLKAERERIREQQQQDEEELKKLNRQAAKKKAASAPVFEAMQVSQCCHRFFWKNLQFKHEYIVERGGK